MLGGAYLEIFVLAAYLGTIELSPLDILKWWVKQTIRGEYKVYYAYSTHAGISPSCCVDEPHVLAGTYALCAE